MDMFGIGEPYVSRTSRP